MGGRGLLTVDRHGNQPLVFRFDVRDLHGGHEAQPLFVHLTQQLRDKGIKAKIPHDLFVVHIVRFANDLNRAFSHITGSNAVQPSALVLDGLHFQIQQGGQFAGKCLISLLVTVPHGLHSFLVGHIPDNKGHFLQPGQLTAASTAVARDNLKTVAVFLRAGKTGNHNAVCFNGRDGFLHLGVIRDLERMGTECVERVELGKFQIDQLALLHRTGRGRRCLGLRRDPGTGASTTASGGLFRGGSLLDRCGLFTLGHFVSRFGRLGLVGGRLVSLGWAVPAGLCRRLLFVCLGCGLLRFFSLRGTATAGLFLFSRNLLLRLFLRGLFSRFLGLAGSGSLRGKRFGLFHSMAGRRPLFCHQLLDFLKGYNHIARSGLGRGSTGPISYGSLEGVMLLRARGLFLFFHLLTSYLFVMLHKISLENFVLIF